MGAAAGIDPLFDTGDVLANGAAQRRAYEVCGRTARQVPRLLRTPLDSPIAGSKIRLTNLFSIAYTERTSLPNLGRFSQ